MRKWHTSIDYRQGSADTSCLASTTGSEAILRRASLDFLFWPVMTDWRTDFVYCIITHEVIGDNSYRIAEAVSVHVCMTSMMIADCGRWKLFTPKYHLFRSVIRYLSGKSLLKYNTKVNCLQWCIINSKKCFHNAPALFITNILHFRSNVWLGYIHWNRPLKTTALFWMDSIMTWWAPCIRNQDLKLIHKPAYILGHDN